MSAVDEARARLERVEEGDMWTATNLLDVATLADEVERLRVDNAVLVAALAHEWGGRRDEVTALAREFAPTWADETDD